MTGTERAFDYKIKWWVILLFAGVFGLGAVLLGHKASGNDPDNLPGLYWVLCALSIWFVARAGAWTVGRLLLRHRVAFTRTCLLVPKSMWSSEEVAIEYQAITGLSTSTLSGPRRLYVTHPGGRHTILSGLLPSEAAFDEVCELLTARARAVQQVGHA